MTDKTSQDIALLQQDVASIKITTESTFKILKGNNGQKGLVTDVELVKAGLSRAWWWLGGVSLAILATAAYIVRYAIRSSL